MRRTNPDPFWDLVAVLRHLQGPEGCAWDRAQSFESLFPHLLEETWEVLEAFRAKRRAHLQEELGDVLYTVLFLTLIAEHRGWLRLEDLLKDASAKMVRRHPHVFETRSAHSPSEAYAQWQKVKKGERKQFSRGKALRPLLIKVWDVLYRKPEAADRLSRWVRATTARASTSRSALVLSTRHGRVSGSRSASARPKQQRARSSRERVR